jgi:hypothetical protein
MGQAQQELRITDEKGTEETEKKRRADKETEGDWREAKRREVASLFRGMICRHVSDPVREIVVFVGARVPGVAADSMNKYLIIESFDLKRFRPEKNATVRSPPLRSSGLQSSPGDSCRLSIL